MHEDDFEQACDLDRGGLVLVVAVLAFVFVIGAGFGYLAGA